MEDQRNTFPIVSLPLQLFFFVLELDVFVFCNVFVSDYVFICAIVVGIIGMRLHAFFQERELEDSLVVRFVAENGKISVKILFLLW